MTNFDDIFLEYEKIVDAALEGKVKADKVDALVDLMNSYISGYAEISDNLKGQYRRWNGYCERYCRLRDSLIKIQQRNKENQS